MTKTIDHETVKKGISRRNNSVEISHFEHSLHEVSRYRSTDPADKIKNLKKNSSQEIYT